MDNKITHARVGDDPLEIAVAVALDKANINYYTDYEGRSPQRLDFFLVDYDLYIEVKSGHTDRISKQTSRHQNVIAIQGIKSVKFLERLLNNIN